MAQLQVEMARNRLHRFKVREAALALREAFSLSPTVTARHGWRQIQIGVARKLPKGRIFSSDGPSLIGRNFDEVEPFPTDPTWRPRRNISYLQMLEQLDLVLGSQFVKESGGLETEGAASPP
jgi:hypothetical protein